MRPLPPSRALAPVDHPGFFADVDEAADPDLLALLAALDEAADEESPDEESLTEAEWEPVREGLEPAK